MALHVLTIFHAVLGNGSQARPPPLGEVARIVQGGNIKALTATATRATTKLHAVVGNGSLARPPLLMVHAALVQVGNFKTPLATAARARVVRWGNTKMAQGIAVVKTAQRVNIGHRAAPHLVKLALRASPPLVKARQAVPVPNQIAHGTTVEHDTRRLVW